LELIIHMQVGILAQECCEPFQIQWTMYCGGPCGKSDKTLFLHLNVLVGFVGCKSRNNIL